MAKKQYYDISKIMSTGARWLILLGQRANGKSYQAKKVALENAIAGKGKFIYLRRWKEDIKTKAVENYFNDMPIYKLTGGAYDSVIAWQGEIYLAKIDEDGKLAKGTVIGSYCALNEHERYKSQAFVGYSFIIFEEFITDSAYLVDEPRQLLQFVSTVARNELITVIMVGNTLSRVCPYFSEFALDGTLKMQAGEIQVYHHHTQNGVVDIAVEYCASLNMGSNMFFGQSAKQIVSGEWDTVEVPHLPQHQLNYETIYELLVEYQKFKFVIQLLVETTDGGLLCFIYPQTSDKKFNRIITETFSDKPNISRYLNDNIKAEKLIRECFNNDKVCYSDNLTGADFKHILDNSNLLL